MKRRRFVGSTAPALMVCLGLPMACWAQPAGRVFRIGYLSAPSRAAVANALQAFLRALHELGWDEGRNLVIEYRWAEGHVERLPELAAELVRLKVDLIVAPASTAAMAAKKLTDSIPIVMIFPVDPVGTGLVASLARPGGNVTGTTFASGPEIFSKQLQLLKEAVPQAQRFAVLRNPADPSDAALANELAPAARSLGLRLQEVHAVGPEDFDAAFAAMAREKAQALVVGRGTIFLVHRARLAELALKGHLPTMYSTRENIEAGGLMAYGVNMSDFIGRAASYVDKILRGARPADLPVEQPTTFELVVNLKTARALGLTVPSSVLLNATDVVR